MRNAALLTWTVLALGCATKQPAPPREPAYTFKVLEARSAEAIAGAEVSVFGAVEEPDACGMPSMLHTTEFISIRTNAEGVAQFFDAPPHSEPSNCPPGAPCVTPRDYVHYVQVRAEGYLTYVSAARGTTLVSLAHAVGAAPLARVATRIASGYLQNAPMLAGTAKGRRLPTRLPLVCLTADADWRVTWPGRELSRENPVGAEPAVTVLVDPETGSAEIVSCPAHGTAIRLLWLAPNHVHLVDQNTGMAIDCDGCEGPDATRLQCPPELAPDANLWVFRSDAAPEACRGTGSVFALDVGQSWKELGGQGLGGKVLARLTGCTRSAESSAYAH